MADESPLIPGLSRATLSKLADLGYATDGDLEDLEIPKLLEAGIGWSSVHKIVKHLVGDGRTPKFRGPGPDWDEARWEGLVRALVEEEDIVTWEEVAVAVLGELNPPQVGTSLATNPNLQSQYPARKTMQAVMDWFYSQDGSCRNCGRRIHIEVDHIEGKDEYVKTGRNPNAADRLDNLQLLCRRCNVIKRGSHQLGGLTFATAQAALMWILLVERPRTRAEFETLCRAHGLTMASVRFQEAWAMAVWLAAEGRYEIDDD